MRGARKYERGGRQGRSSFLKKKSNRLFILPRFHVAGHGLTGCASAEIKVFWFFSSEKNILPFRSRWQ
jgi:hypothetical protein